MANVTYGKSLILIIFFLLFSLDTFSQKKKLKQFSSEYSTYISELGDFMTASKNDDLKSIYKRFSKNFKDFSEEEKINVIQISNKMLSKRLRANLHFSKFLLAIIDINNSDKRENLLLQWLKVVEETVDNSSNNKLILFFAFSSDLIKNNILRQSKSAEWRISNTDFYFRFKISEPIVVFDNPFNLSCTSDDGSYVIFGTKGEYHFISTEWFGHNGLINWESVGYPKDSVFAEIKSYKLDTRKSTIVADSSIFYNKYIFPEPIFGQVVHKLTKGKQADMFPKFVSYGKNIELKEIFPNIGGNIFQLFHICLFV